MKVDPIQSVVPNVDNLGAERLLPPGLVSHDDLRVTVVLTSRDGTMAALRTASDLAEGLGSRIRLVAPRFIPFQFPLDRPPVAVEFLERGLYDLVCDAGIRHGEVVIQLYLCRDEYACLQRVLSPHSLVVIGQRKRWFKRAGKLERFLKSLGHQVVAVPSRRPKRFWRDWDWESFWTRAAINMAAGRLDIWGWERVALQTARPETHSGPRTSLPLESR
jgi:hypothetical protein